VVVEVDDEPPLVIDLGTGLRPLGHVLEAVSGDRPLHVSALLSHLHWDHLIGLPFFTPLQRAGGTMDVYGPPQEGGSLHEVIDRVVQPPFFPVQVKELHGSVAFHEVADDDLGFGAAKVRIRRVPHLGTTLGFRVEAHGRSLAYVSDHQAPADLRTIAPSVLELCDGVDLLVHDAQYSEEEFAAKASWGHCTVGYAVHVAAEAGVRQLALFHHDPAHTDDTVERLVEVATTRPAATRLEEVLPAVEGLSLVLSPR